MNLFEKQSRLNQLFTQSPVNTAYLAGTLSSRTAFGHLTDVDIAILLMEQIKSDQFLDYQLYFFSELAKRLESDNIDVVILNQASLLLKLQVIKYGQILFSLALEDLIVARDRALVVALQRRLGSPGLEPPPLWAGITSRQRADAAASEATT